MALFRTRKERRADRQANREQRREDRSDRSGMTGAERRQDRRTDRQARGYARQERRQGQITSAIEDLTGVAAAKTAASDQQDAINKALAAAGWVEDPDTGEMVPPSTPPPSVLDPYTNAGSSALGAQGDLLGLNGPEAQQSAIDALQNGPMFTSLMSQGENAILQNASATGGLRGGNTQAALGTLGPQVLSSVIQNQLGGLGGVSGMGLGAAGTQAGINASTLANIQNLLTGSGDVAASSDLAGFQNPYQFIQDLIGMGVGLASGLPT